MTMTMPDSTDTRNLPPGYPAYLGYNDGRWPTMNGYTAPDGSYVPALPVLFPAADLLGLTVTGSTTDDHHGIHIASGIDAEPGNPTAATAVRWVVQKLALEPGSRPVVYADLGSPGYSMIEIIDGLAHAGVARADYRILTAHWTNFSHICGPRPQSCGGLPVNADGTQWTDRAPGEHGSLIDMSLLADNFFTGGIVTDKLKPITVLPPGNWHTAVLVGTANGQTYAEQWDGKAWKSIAWPVTPAS